MRDRLIELLEQTGMIENSIRCKIAAHELMANGVVVPPCKVGDMIYRITAYGSIMAWDIVKMEVYVDEIGYVDDSDNWIGLDDFGKTVFLTKEEAEKTLKALRGCVK